MNTRNDETIRPLFRTNDENDGMDLQDRSTEPPQGGSDTEMDFEREIVKIHRKLDTIMQAQKATGPTIARVYMSTKVKVALIIVLCAAALMIFFGGYAYRSYLG